MKYLLLLIPIVLGFLHVRYIRSTGHFFPQLQGNNVPPHKRWPEILHWRKGDKFENLTFTNHTQYNLIAVQEDGWAAVEFCGDKERVPISYLVGNNVSLRSRRISAEVARSHEYMELIEQFQISYRELENRDKRNGIAA